jgi:hypothetical protein
MRLRIQGANSHPIHEKLLSVLSSTSFDLVLGDEDFDFILPAFDAGSAGAAEIAQARGKYFPDTGFINKLSLEEKCLASNIPTLPSGELSIASLTNCTYPHFIIKPKVWSGGKHPLQWVYRIFSQAEKQQVLDLIGSRDDLQTFMLQQALIDPATKETYLIFVDGVVNGSGQIHFNSIADKWMKNPDALDSHITHRAGIRLVSSEDKYGFKQKITTLLQANNIRNTPFKAQAIVDEANNICYINDWSWGIMPYTHLHLLDPMYLNDHLCFAYDVIPAVTKPIDKIIVMNHIEFPLADYTTEASVFDAKYKALADQHGVTRTEPLNHGSVGTITPQTSNFYVLHGIACDDVEAGKAALSAFQAAVDQQ